ncbi:unnamed protein product [Caenorhabditis angaria]|uniref:Uncharacterized protein n=1 Tax=Caenorhabditis angaria TaxID=860376 RepID=A0A9P1N4S5_9PELO|nr:unnamed protein product [Caenorhabditis angaria]
MSTTSFSLVLLLVIFACFVAVDAQWGYGYGRPYGGYGGYGRGYGYGRPWGRPFYGGYRPYGGYGWGK